MILRNGTVYGHSPRMRFDLVVNTFVKDALVNGRLQLHGGGWMWRPLVDVRDCADAMIAAMEAPADLVRGEIFNVLHSNYQIRELAMLVAGSVQLLGSPVDLSEAPAPPLTRNYECSNAKLAGRIGFNPSRSVVDAVADLLAADRSSATRPVLTDPRHYNIRWLELLNEVRPRDRAVRLGALSGRVLITGGGGQLASDLERNSPRRASCVSLTRAAARRHRRRRAGARVRRVPARRRSTTAPPSTTSRSASARRPSAFAVNATRGQADGGPLRRARSAGWSI